MSDATVIRERDLPAPVRAVVRRLLRAAPDHRRAVDNPEDVVEGLEYVLSDYRAVTRCARRCRDAVWEEYG